MLEATIGELQQGLEEGRYTSEDLVNYYLERIAVYDESLYNSLVTINEEAVSLSRELDAERAAGNLRGPLHGIPIVVKDNIDVAGLPTTNGYSVNWNNIAGTDAEAVRLLKEAGAIVLAKGNMSTGAQIARYTISDAAGETLNAYNTDYSAGGSSGGVSVAVAANFAAAGIGTDTNSSIRYPAALASLVGLRPTFGLISLDGVEVLNWDRDTVGTLTRTVEDTACLLSAMTGNDYTVYLGASGLAGRKIGVVLELTGQGESSPADFAYADEEVLSQFWAAMDALESCGAEVVTVSLPNLFQLSAATPENYTGSAGAKARLRAAVDALFEEYALDAMAYPSYLTAPLSSGYGENGAPLADTEPYTNTGSFLSSPIGYPAVNLPSGFLECGVSTGLQLMAQAGTSMSRAAGCAPRPSCVLPWWRRPLPNRRRTPSGRRKKRP